MKYVVAFLSMFTSFGTLFCCAIPALFVTLGFGATFAGLTAAVPQLIWIAVHKDIIFLSAGTFLILGFALQRIYPPPVQCDVDGNACETTKSWTTPLMLLSSTLFAIGGFFAFVAPHIL